MKMNTAAGGRIAGSPPATGTGTPLVMLGNYCGDFGMLSASSLSSGLLTRPPTINLKSPFPAQCTQMQPFTCFSTVARSQPSVSRTWMRFHISALRHIESST